MKTATPSPESLLRLDGILHAFVNFDRTLPKLAAGTLDGWNVAIKDNFDVAGQIVSVGAPMFATRRATGTATAVQRMLDAGAEVVGRTQMVELAFGGWGINAALGSPRNPWDARVERVAGGSSSGSGVAVAARMSRAALGGDTAGSIRMPAALCGITGLKTTFGLIPVDGVFPLAPSYDTVGPMAQSAADCSRLFEVLTQTRLAPMEAAQGWQIARLDGAAYPVQVELDVQRALDQAATVFEGLGAKLYGISPPFSLADLTRDAGTLIGSEFLALHRTRFETQPQAFGADVRHRLEQARNVTPRTIAEARSARAEATERFEAWLPHDDVLLLPTVHCAAPPFAAVNDRSAPLGQFTRWVNHVGGCALSLPAGFDRSGLPLAIQLVGRAAAEGRLLALGCAFQKATDWHRREPDLSWASSS